MRHIEDQLQKACVRWFDLQYPKLSKYLVCVPNGGKRNAIEAAKLKHMGVRAGFPDLILLLPNSLYPFMGIELKTSKGRQSLLQKDYEVEFNNIGARYVIVRSIEDFIDAITSHMEYINEPH